MNLSPQFGSNPPNKDIKSFTELDNFKDGEFMNLEETEMMTGEMPMSEFFKKELTFQVSASYGPGRYDDRYELEGIDYPKPFVRWTENRNFETILNLIKENLLTSANSSSINNSGSIELTTTHLGNSRPLLLCILVTKTSEFLLPSIKSIKPNVFLW